MDSSRSSKHLLSQSIFTPASFPLASSRSFSRSQIRAGAGGARVPKILVHATRHKIELLCGSLTWGTIEGCLFISALSPLEFPRMRLH